MLTASIHTGTTNHLTSVTDSAGNTWTRAGAYSVSGHFSDGELWYCANAKSTSSVVAKVASSTIVATRVSEFSGIAATGALEAATGSSNTGHTAASGSVTAPRPKDLVVGFAAGHDNAQTMTIATAGYTSQPQVTSKATTISTVLTGYQVLAASAAVSLTATFSTTMYWAAGVAVFLPAG